MEWLVFLEAERPMGSRIGVISAYSLSWGVLSAEELILHLKTLGVSKVAVCDRDTIGGYPRLREVAAEEEIELILGCSLSEGEETIYAFVQDQRGYEELCALLSNRYLESSYSYLSDLQHTALHLAATNDLPIEADHLYRALTPTHVSKGTSTYPLLAIDDSFLDTEESRIVHKTLVAIGQNKTVGSLKEESYCQSGKVLLDQATFEAIFAPWPEAIVNAESLIAYDPFPKSHIFPTVTPTNGLTPIAELRRRVYLGAEKRYGEVSDEVVHRLEYELSIIETKHFASYFLIIDDIVALASRSCGRGSAAASLVAYVLEITNVDPIAHNLYFERFLSLGRVDPPDIDVDFAWDERAVIFDAIKDRYGENHVARVANHIFYRRRNALRECARAWGQSDRAINQVIDQPESGDSSWPMILSIAKAIVGLPKEVGTHSGGVIITPKPFTTYAPVSHNSEGYPLVVWEKDGCEAAGFVKLDILGNRSLAVIRDALANLSEDAIFIDEQSWKPNEDLETQNTLARGDSMGVFYIESPAMRQLQKKTQKGDFDHIVIHSSMIRPAANRFIGEYIQRLKGKPYTHLHPRLETILGETYGILCYQEDVSKTAIALAGFDEIEADQLRKIIAKKHATKRLHQYKQHFVQGCKANNISTDTIEEAWSMMLSFDGYSFCKPHSASYAIVSFQSAYLRTHYPAYFLAAVLTNQGGYYQSGAYVSEGRRMGLIVEGPDLNQSRREYVARGNTITVGFMAIANLSEKAILQIIEERTRGGIFHSLEEASTRLKLTREDWQALSQSGTLDCLAPNTRRSDQLRVVLTTSYKEQSNLQLELFNEPKKMPPRVLPSTRRTLDELHAEYESLLFLRTTHPLILYHRHVSRVNRIQARDLFQYVKKQVTLIGWPITIKTVFTSAREVMAFFSFEDETALYETVLFPQVYRQYERLLTYRTPLIIEGFISDDEGALIVEVNRLSSL